MQALDHERRLVARERQMVEETQAKLQGRERELRDREETFRKRLDQKIEERLRDARREIDVGRRRAEGARRGEADRRAARLVPTGEIGAVRADARSALDAIEAKVREAERCRSAFAPFGSSAATAPAHRRPGRGRAARSRRDRAVDPRWSRGRRRARQADAGAGRRAARAHAGGGASRRRRQVRVTSTWRRATRQLDRNQCDRRELGGSGRAGRAVPRRRVGRRLRTCASSTATAPARCGGRSPSSSARTRSSRTSGPPRTTRAAAASLWWS